MLVSLGIEKRMISRVKRRCLPSPPASLGRLCLSIWSASYWLALQNMFSYKYIFSYPLWLLAFIKSLYELPWIRHRQQRISKRRIWRRDTNIDLAERQRQTLLNLTLSRLNIRPT